MIHFGDGPAYALIRDAKEGAGKTRLFHSSDRSLVEHLAFRLQQELSVPSQLPGTRGGPGMSGLVLIADGDQQRALRIAEACARERARDARDEPRRSRARGGALRPAGGAGGAARSAADRRREARRDPARQPAHPADAALFVQRARRSQRAQRPPGRADRRPGRPRRGGGRRARLLGERDGTLPSPEAKPLASDGIVEGELAQIPLADLLQLFHVNRETGRFELTRELEPGRSARGEIVLREGDVIAASVEQRAGEKALFRLLGVGARALHVQARARDRAGARSSVRRARCCARASASVDECGRLAVDLPPLAAHVTLRVQRSALPNVIHPLTQEVLVVLEIYTRVQDVVDHCSLPRLPGPAHAAHAGRAAGMIELRRGPGPEDTAGDDTGLFAPAHVARLRDWLEAGTPRGTPPRDAKLLVVASDAGATRDFVRMLARLPGVAIDERFTLGSYSADDLTTLGRITVDGELGIELLHTPTAPRFAPLWPLAGHGRSERCSCSRVRATRAVDAVRPTLEALRRLPRSRAFSLLLLEKGERVVPDEVRENLSLLDQGSLFLFPLESSGKSSGLLREMFAARGAVKGAELERFALLAGLGAADREALAGALETLELAAGTKLFDVGDPADGLLLVADGGIGLTSDGVRGAAASSAPATCSERMRSWSTARAPRAPRLCLAHACCTSAARPSSASPTTQPRAACRLLEALLREQAHTSARSARARRRRAG